MAFFSPVPYNINRLNIVRDRSLKVGGGVGGSRKIRGEMAWKQFNKRGVQQQEGAWKI